MELTNIGVIEDTATSNPAIKLELRHLFHGVVNFPKYIRSIVGTVAHFSNLLKILQRIVSYSFKKITLYDIVFIVHSMYEFKCSNKSMNQRNKEMIQENNVSNVRYNIVS